MNYPTGSMMGRLVHCPGSFKLCSDYPEKSGNNQIANEGSTAHWLAAFCHTNDSDTEKQIGSAPVVEDCIIDVEMADNIEWYIGHLWSISGTGEGDLEVRLGIDGFSGTPDYIFYNHLNRKLTVVDLKYGFKSVEVHQNWQLISYAYLWCLNNIDLVVENVEFNIYQPRAYHHDGISRTWTIPFGELENYYFFKLKETLEYIHLPGSPTKSGSHCHYCSAMLNCKTNFDTCLNIVNISEAPCVGEIDNYGIGKQLELFEHAQMILRQRISVLKSVGEVRVKKGGVVPGYGIVGTRGNRKWNISKQKAKAFGIPFKEPELISPSEAEMVGVPKSLVSLNVQRKSGMKFAKVDILAKVGKMFGPS